MIPEKAQCSKQTEIEVSDQLAESGIYAITHPASGRRYVGSAARGFKRRFAEHRAGLKKGNHHSPHLQNAWNKYGPEAFEWVVLELVKGDRAAFLAREQFHIDSTPQALRFNCAQTAGSLLGWKHSEASRKKISTSQKGRESAMKGKVPWNKGKRQDDAHKQAAIEGFKKGQETRKAAGLEHPNKGRQWSEEAIAKMKATQEVLKLAREEACIPHPNKGKKRGRKPMSEEQRAANKKRQKEAAEARRISGEIHPNKGKPRSQDLKDKIKASWVLRKSKAVSIPENERY